MTKTAFRHTAEYSKPSQSAAALSLDELILGGRLAARLGGSRLSRRLFRTAGERYPADARARYFGQHLWTKGWNLFEQLREPEKNPELDNADDVTQSSWLAWQAVSWAALRDFDRAHQCLARAKELGTRESWVFSCESSALGLEDHWEEALSAAETSWEMSPGTSFAAHSLSESLVNLRRVPEAAEPMSAASENCESYEVTQTACWHLWAGEARGYSAMPPASGESYWGACSSVSGLAISGWGCLPASSSARLASFFCSRRSSFSRRFSARLISFCRFLNVMGIPTLLELRCADGADY